MSRANQILTVSLFRLSVCVGALLALSIYVAAQEDETRNASPRTGAISGRVVNENGQPVAHAAIYVNAPMNPLQSRVSVTDDGGNFQVSGLDVSIYTISASAPSYIMAPRDPDALPTYYRIGDSPTINLMKGGVVTGSVSSPTGDPMVQAGVRATMLRDANGKPPGAGRFAIDRQTDDRGIYRIYGLPTGTYIISAGGRGTYGYSNNPYDSDAPTYAPSSARDTAAEVSVHAGEEITVDVRYRGEAGHVVSGAVTGPIAPNSNANVTLSQIVNGIPLVSAFSIQPFNRKGFAFYGIADGDYDLIAQSSIVPGETIGSEPRRITVKGADVTGLELAVKELASIRGRLLLEQSTAAECKNKRQPLFSETVLMTRRSDKNAPKGQPIFLNLFAQSVPEKSGEFGLRNLSPGQFKLNVRFFAKYWYLRSIIRENPGSSAPRSVAMNRPINIAGTGINLKFGERISGVTVTLAEGAASLRGTLKVAEGESVPAKLFLYLAPIETENADDVLRFFSTPIQADGTFGLNNLPPGRYWALAREATDREAQSDARSFDEADTRLKIRRAAEAAKNEVQFKPCQNVVDYQLPFKTSIRN